MALSTPEVRQVAIKADSTAKFVLHYAAEGRPFILKSDLALWEDTERAFSKEVPQLSEIKRRLDDDRRIDKRQACVFAWLLVNETRLFHQLRKQHRQLKHYLDLLSTLTLAYADESGEKASFMVITPPSPTFVSTEYVDFMRSSNVVHYGEERIASRYFERYWQQFVSSSSYYTCELLGLLRLQLVPQEASFKTSLNWLILTADLGIKWLLPQEYVQQKQQQDAIMNHYDAMSILLDDADEGSFDRGSIERTKIVLHLFVTYNYDMQQFNASLSPRANAILVRWVRSMIDGTLGNEPLEPRLMRSIKNSLEQSLNAKQEKPYVPESNRINFR